MMNLDKEINSIFKAIVGSTLVTAFLIVVQVATIIVHTFRLIDDGPQTDSILIISFSVAVSIFFLYQYGRSWRDHRHLLRLTFASHVLNHSHKIDARLRLGAIDTAHIIRDEP